MVRLETEGRIVDVIGSPRTFTNAELAEDGNAALALNLIGTHSELVWYLPQYESTADDGTTTVRRWSRRTSGTSPGRWPSPCSSWRSGAAAGSGRS